MPNGKKFEIKCPEKNTKNRREEVGFEHQPFGSLPPEPQSLTFALAARAVWFQVEAGMAPAGVRARCIDANMFAPM